MAFRATAGPPATLAVARAHVGAPCARSLCAFVQAWTGSPAEARPPRPRRGRAAGPRRIRSSEVTRPGPRPVGRPGPRPGRSRAQLEDDGARSRRRSSPTTGRPSWRRATVTRARRGATGGRRRSVAGSPASRPVRAGDPPPFSKADDHHPRPQGRQARRAGLEPGGGWSPRGSPGWSRSAAAGPRWRRLARGSGRRQARSASLRGAGAGSEAPGSGARVGEERWPGSGWRPSTGRVPRR